MKRLTGDTIQMRAWAYDALAKERHEAGLRYRMERSRRAAALRAERMAAARALGDHSTEQWFALREEFDNRCVRCCAPYRIITRDHIVPIFMGGSNGIENIQPMCTSCNSGKGTDTTNWAEIRRKEGFPR